MNCPHCNQPIQGELVRTAAALDAQSKRTYTRKLRLCPKGCGRSFGAREMRKHIPTCIKKSTV